MTDSHQKIKELISSIGNDSELLVAALRIAHCYMPSLDEIDDNGIMGGFGDNKEQILEEVNFVRDALLKQGIDPDNNYAQLNPVINKK
jgi:hypothetical protein